MSASNVTRRAGDLAKNGTAASSKADDIGDTFSNGRLLGQLVLLDDWDALTIGHKIEDLGEHDHGLGG